MSSASRQIENMARTIIELQARVEELKAEVARWQGMCGSRRERNHVLRARVEKLEAALNQAGAMCARPWGVCFDRAALDKEQT